MQLHSATHCMSRSSAACRSGSKCMLHCCLTCLCAAICLVQSSYSARDPMIGTTPTVSHASASDIMVGAGFTLCSSSWGRPSAFLQHLCHEVRSKDNSEGGGSGGHPAQQAGQPDPLVAPGQVPSSWRPQGTALPQPSPAPTLPCPNPALPPPCAALPTPVFWTPAYLALLQPHLFCLQLCPES